MISSVNVKYGKPIYMIPHRYLRFMGIAVVVINVIIIIYVIEMFSLALSVKQKLGDYIDLLWESGYVLPMIVGLSALCSFFVNIFTILVIYNAFRSVNKIIDCILMADVLLTTVLALILFCLMFASLGYGYQAHPKFITHLLGAMKNYSKDGLIKTKIDRLQIEFQCCGSRNYTDWYDIDWYDTNFIQLSSETTVSGETPFSCCSIRSQFPCIHHGLESGWGAYKYSPDSNFSLSSQGCFDIIEKKKRITSWRVVGYIFSLLALNIFALVPLRFLQTAHLERGRFDKEGHIYTAWFFGCYAGKKKAAIREAPPVPPLPPEFIPHNALVPK